MLILRKYQQEAIEKIIRDQSIPGNSLVVLPTGSGKSIVIAETVNQLRKDILILQPTKEILEQNYEKLCKYVDKNEIGIYSASMNEKTIKKFTLATIASIYKKPELFSHFKLVILDECHLLNPKNLEGMFASFLKAIGNPKVIGLSATPYRLTPTYIPSKTPWISQWEAATSIKLINRLQGKFWARILYVKNIRDLIDEGYLVPLSYITKQLFNEFDLKTNKSMSDYDMESYEGLLEGQERHIINYIEGARDFYTSTLIFCSSVEQAKQLSGKIEGCEYVSAETNKKERERIINGFKEGSIKVVCNVGVLTTGFDHPELDCIVLLRPTQSLGLYYQMLGRGVRTAPGKKTCAVLDLSGTIRRLGVIESIRLIEQEGKWELLTETETGTKSWHGRILYRFAINNGKKI